MQGITNALKLDDDSCLKGVISGLYAFGKHRSLVEGCSEFRRWVESTSLEVEYLAGADSLIRIKIFLDPVDSSLDILPLNEISNRSVEKLYFGVCTIGVKSRCFEKTFTTAA